MPTPTPKRPRFTDFCLVVDFCHSTTTRCTALMIDRSAYLRLATPYPLFCTRQHARQQVGLRHISCHRHADTCGVEVLPLIYHTAPKTQHTIYNRHVTHDKPHTVIQSYCCVPVCKYVTELYADTRVRSATQRARSAFSFSWHAKNHAHLAPEQLPTHEANHAAERLTVHHVRQPPLIKPRRPNRADVMPHRVDGGWVNRHHAHCRRRRSPSSVLLPCRRCGNSAEQSPGKGCSWRSNRSASQQRSDAGCLHDCSCCAHVLTRGPLVTCEYEQSTVLITKDNAGSAVKL